MKTRWMIKATIIATVLVCLTACGGQEPSGSGTNSKPDSEVPSVPSEPENEDKDKTLCYEGNKWYLIQNGELWGMGNTSGEELSGKVIIPSNVEGNVITSIPSSSYVFRNKTLITEIVLPDTLNNLPNGIFWGCDKLKKVRLPRNLTVIPGSAFYGCKSLVEITLPDETYKIGEHAFDGCISLKKIVVPAKVSMLDNGAFRGCEGLEEVYLPKSLKYIGIQVFPYKWSLKKVYFAGNREEWDTIEFPAYGGDRDALENIMIFEE